MEPVIEIPVVAPRQPCPCGSGRRYKSCHGSNRADRMVTLRPFAGRVDEADWVALREVVPSAVAPLKLKDPAYADRSVFLTTVLPAGWPGLVRSDGVIYVALQTPRRCGDLARDLGQVVNLALETEPGNAVQGLPAAPDAPRVHDLVADEAIDVAVLDNFAFWVESMADETGALRTALESANASIVPTARLASVEAAYWCRIKERAHLRWAMAQDEDVLLDALARLAATRSLGLGEGTKCIGAFRACGLLIPVWDLPGDLTAGELERPAAELAARLEETLADLVAHPRKPNADEQRARSGLLSRQLTLN
ncbi:MAG: DUF5926 family protein [Actinomycetota bacterium]